MPFVPCPSLTEPHVVYALRYAAMYQRNGFTLDDLYMDAEGLWSDELHDMSDGPSDLDLYAAMDYLVARGVVYKATDYSDTDHTTMRYTVPWPVHTDASGALPMVANLQRRPYRYEGCSADYLDDAWAIFGTWGPDLSLHVVEYYDGCGFGLVLSFDDMWQHHEEDTRRWYTVAEVQGGAPSDYMALYMRAVGLKYKLHALTSIGEELSY